MKAHTRKTKTGTIKRGVSQQGFTLIELMAVIVILAVLLMVALPAYQNQIIRGHRAAAKAEILDLANRQEQFLLANRTYTNDATDFSYTLPPDVATRYSFTISTFSASIVPEFLITFTPIGDQAEDGDLTLDSQGTKVGKWDR